MSEIKQLPKELSNLISAGEVVERPASVVKELVENSIDAGSTKIEVEIRDGGISYIRVTDNGKGIQADDMPVAFLRHATSKIRDENDLFAIGTLGFRGEALAAIAAVSKIDIFSRYRLSQMGTHMVLEGGEQKEISEHGCPKGTTIVVQDLFYNTPARMKFLKSDKTEAGYISGILEHLAVSKPQIAMKFIKNGRQVFSTVGDGDLRKAVYSVYGGEFSEGLISIAGQSQGVEVYGIISPESMTRSNRNMQNFFINGRYIKSKLLYAAVERAYQGRILSGKMPICFINLVMPYMSVDVNVHPSKMEVKFANEKKIFDVVYNLITDALNSAALGKCEEEKQPECHNPVVQDDVSTYPKEYFSGGVVDGGNNVTEFYKKIIKYKSDMMQKEEKEKSFEEAPQQKFSEDLYTQKEPPMQRQPSAAQPFSPYTSKATQLYSEKAPEPPTPKRENYVFETKEQPKSAVIIGEAFKTYIIVEHDNQLKLIDKHAVHEKMVYNKIMSKEPEQFGQYLVSPVNITLTREEKALVSESSKIFDDMGFEIDDLGANNISVRKAPSYIDHGDIEDAVTQIIGKISEHRFAYGDMLDDIIKNVACKAAIKAGFINVKDELRVLVDAVFSDARLQTCPHGRPTVFAMSRYQIEKMFKRS